MNKLSQSERCSVRSFKTQTTRTHFQMDSLSMGYFLRLSSSACMVVLRPPLVVMRHEDRRPRKASRISAEDSWMRVKVWLGNASWNIHDKIVTLHVYIQYIGRCMYMYYDKIYKVLLICANPSPLSLSISPLPLRPSSLSLLPPLPSHPLFLPSSTPRDQQCTHSCPIIL